MARKSTYLIFAVILIASLALLGWQLDIELFKRPIPGFVAMNPVTALAFVLASLSFLFIRRNKSLALAAQLLAAVVIALGAIKLIAVITGYDAGIDHWLYPGKIATELLSGRISRMAPNTAFCFVIYGLALLMYSFNSIPARKGANYLAAMVLVAGMFSVTGYLYRVKEYYGILTYLPMAINTAISFILAGMALILFNNQVGFMRLFSGKGAGGRVARVLIPASIGVPLILGYIRLSAQRAWPVTVELGVAVLISANIIVLLCLIWYMAIVLNRSDEERIKAEGELQRQAELFRVMPDAVMYGTGNVDQIIITSLNNAAEELFDVKAADAVGYTMDNFVKIEVAGLTREEVRKELWGEKGYWKGEIVFTTRTGRKVNALVTLKTIKDNERPGSAWMGIFTDVTVLKRTEQRLEFTLDGMVAGLWEWDIVNNKRWWSPKYFELLDYENNEIEPSRETLLQLMHPDDAPMVFDTIGQYLNKTESFEIEHRFKLKSGIYHWFRATGKTRFDASGKPLMMAGSIIDIDEKKRALDMIKQQARLIQMVPDGIIFSSKSRKFVDVNAGAEEMFDLIREKVIGKNIDEFISLAFAPGVKFEDEFAALWRDGFWHGEMQVTNRKTGKVVSVLANIKTVENMDGGEPGYMTIYTDLSPLMVNKELKAANEYLEQLAFISAHDIKAPIHSISGLTDVLLESENLTAEQVNILQMQKDVVLQMEQTNKGLNDILQFRKGLLSRDTTGGGSLTLKEIVDNVISGLRAVIESSGADVQVSLGDAADVQFPYFYMQSIFHNLIANSIKYRDPNRPLAVIVEAKKTESGSFLFSVADNAMGFDMSLFGNKIFGIFKRFHPHIDGTGIGLHLVKSIVDAFGGEITVQSGTGKGTKFEITLKNPYIG